MTADVLIVAGGLVLIGTCLLPWFDEINEATTVPVVTRVYVTELLWVFGPLAGFAVVASVIGLVHSRPLPTGLNLAPVVVVSTVLFVLWCLAQMVGRMIESDGGYQPEVKPLIGTYGPYLAEALLVSGAALLVIARRRGAAARST